MSADVLLYGAVAWVAVNIGIALVFAWWSPTDYRNVQNADGSYPE